MSNQLLSFISPNQAKVISSRTTLATANAKYVVDVSTYLFYVFSTTCI